MISTYKYQCLSISLPFIRMYSQLQTFYWHLLIYHSLWTATCKQHSSYNISTHCMLYISSKNPCTASTVTELFFFFNMTFSLILHFYPSSASERELITSALILATGKLSYKGQVWNFKCFQFHYPLRIKWLTSRFKDVHKNLPTSLLVCMANSLLCSVHLSFSPAKPLIRLEAVCILWRQRSASSSKV